MHDLFLSINSYSYLFCVCVCFISVKTVFILCPSSNSFCHTKYFYHTLCDLCRLSSTSSSLHLSLSLLSPRLLLYHCDLHVNVCVYCAGGRSHHRGLTRRSHESVCLHQEKWSGGFLPRACTCRRFLGDACRSFLVGHKLVLS